jgi:uncharacterized membrane protein YeaQ/YmgE (transglycosylase-associated protein family)
VGAANSTEASRALPLAARQAKEPAMLLSSWLLLGVMGLISWIVLGLIAGLAAKWLMPGRDPGGINITMVLGIGGALIGGFIAAQLGLGGISGFDLRSLAIAIGGALLILAGYRWLKQRGHV